MAKPDRTTDEIAQAIRGHHIPLAVACGLARTQLVPDPLKLYDGKHLSDMLDAVGLALAKVATLYESGRPLSPLELDGSSVRRGATQLVLKDGRVLSRVTMKRGDMVQAVAILKVTGVPHLTPPEEKSPPPVDLPAMVAEIETLLRPPLVPTQVERANRLLVSIARSAPSGSIANLAMRLMSASDDALLLARLRVALEVAEKSKT